LPILVTMNVISSVITWAMQQRYRKIDAVRNRPLEIQEKVFAQLLTNAKLTKWGKQHGYKNIKTYREFAEQTPISTYEDLVPWFERIMLGEESALWPGKVTMFSKSSGTTNARSKFIPVTAQSLRDCHYKAGKDMIAVYLANREGTKVLSGKNMALGGSLSRAEENNKIWVGDVSALIMKNLPFWAQYLRTPSLDIALMDKWEEKIEAIANVTINQNISVISGVPTWNIVMLNRILEMSKAQHIHEVWPNLEVFLHGAVSFDPYRELFKKLIPGSQMSYLEIYNASEGFFGLQDDLSLPNEMLLMVDYGVFYEFLPLEELGKDFPKAIPLSEVKMGVNYALVISTNAGLWRYLIGDTVRFTNLSPYRIKITGRTKHFINAFGEELIIENAEQAISKACKQTGAIVNNFTAAPIYLNEAGKGGHEWIIEFDKDPESLLAFNQILDATLRTVNSDYDAKRYQDIALQLPVVRKVPSGTFYSWMKRRGKLGGQHKVPRLSNTREYVDDILAMLEEV
jgi:hypothetical protein